MFVSWFDTFLRQVKERPLLLVFDGHRTHIGLDHCLQPLDVACFKPLKGAWDQALLQYQRMNGFRHLQKREFVDILCSVWKKGLSVDNIQAGFQKTGIYPFNCHMYPVHLFDQGLLLSYHQQHPAPANFTSLTVCTTSTGGATSSTSGGATSSASSNVTTSNSGGSIAILSPTGLSLSQSVFVSKFLNPYRQMQPANQVASKRRKINRSAAVITHEEFTVAMNDLKNPAPSKKSCKPVPMKNTVPDTSSSSSGSVSDCENDDEINLPAPLIKRSTQILAQKSLANINIKPGEYVIVQYNPEKMKKADVVYYVGLVINSTLFVASPKPRYFYLLPKIQKPLNLWRIPFFHPKCRPIISDVTSCTFKLSKRLLSYTQRLEHKLSTVALSSLNIVSFFEHNPTLQPTFNNFSNHPNLVLATCDVESLFTKIPLDNLLSLLNHNLPSVCSNPDECSTILSFLHSIITNNTFFGRGQFYLQKIGLAMGACMSSSLANIYLGFLESRILRHFSPPVLLYKRYMDDIFILINNEQNLLETFLSFLHNTFNLTITSSSSPSQVTFLDLRVHIYPHHFDVTFFSKTNIPFRLPLHSDKRPPRQQIYLFKSQLLRLWRVSTNTEYLSQQIIYILNLLPLTGLRRLLTSTLYQFFKPVNISGSINTNYINSAFR
jgi:hypothetical protein